MLVAWCIAGPCALFALALCFRQLHAYSRCERSARRTYYTGVVLMAPVRPGRASPTRRRAARRERCLGAVSRSSGERPLADA